MCEHGHESRPACVAAAVWTILRPSNPSADTNRPENTRNSESLLRKNKRPRNIFKLLTSQPKGRTNAADCNPRDPRPTFPGEDVRYQRSLTVATRAPKQMTRPLRKQCPGNARTCAQVRRSPASDRRRAHEFGAALARRRRARNRRLRATNGVR